MKQAIIIGASSGIGRELAKLLASNGYSVGLTARRQNLLTELASELRNPVFIKMIDVSRPAEAMSLLRELITEMKDVELFVVSAGNGAINRNLDWGLEIETIDVNVLGFAAIMNVAVEHLQTRGSGHIVGISSVAALRGNAEAPAYNASKAFVSNYMQGLRKRFSKLKLPIIVTDAQPGFVNTAMAKGDGLFWVASPGKAAQQIFDAIRKRKRHVYITKRWQIIAWLLKTMPEWLYNRL